MALEKIGVIGHVWRRAGAASVDLSAPSLRLGDRIRIKGHGHEVEQLVESLEVDHVARAEGRPGQLIAIAINGPVREQDEVWRER